jgi:hypothetical protein
MDVAGQLAPARARMDRHHWPLPPWRPHPAQEGLEPDAMRIRGPHLHRRSWMRLRYRRRRGRQFFLKAVCAAGLAALACRGRGVCGVKSSRRR